MNFLKTFVVTATVAVTVIACSKSKEQNSPADQQQSAKVFAYIKSLGFKEADIIDTGDQYIAEGDICFSKNMEIPASPITEQHMLTNLVNATNKLDIKVYPDPSMSVAPSLIPELNAAITEWNSVPGSDLRFRVVNSLPFDILITVGNYGIGVCELGSLPAGGAAGNVIRLNRTYTSTLSTAQRKRNILHELGHSIGFGHTGLGPGVLVPGTPPLDSLSVMNRVPCGTGTTTLSVYDKIALAWAY